MDGYIIIPDSKYRQMFKDTMKELFLLYKSKHNGDTIPVEKMIMGDRDHNISKQIDLLSYFFPGLYLCTTSSTNIFSQPSGKPFTIFAFS